MASSSKDHQLSITGLAPVQEREPLLQTTTPPKEGPFVGGTPEGGVGRLFVAHASLALGVLLALRVVLSVANRVVYKILLVPMNDYAYFVGVFSSIVYVFVYGFLLSSAYGLGYVTDRGILSRYMLGVPKLKLALMGLFDCLGSVLGLIANAKIPGPLIVVLAQMLTPFTMISCVVFRGRRYSFWQVLASMVLISGVLVSIVGENWHKDASGEKLPQWFYALLSVVGLLPNVASFTLKEMVFAEVPNLHVFVINFFSSAFQLLCSFALLPIVYIPGFGSQDAASMPSYVSNAAHCFIGHYPPSFNRTAPDGGDDLANPCVGMPWLFFVYMLFNVTFNVCMLLVVKYGSAVLNFIIGMFATAATFFAFGVPGPDTRLWNEVRISLEWKHYAAILLAMGGLMMYQYSTRMFDRVPKAQQSCLQLLPNPFAMLATATQSWITAIVISMAALFSCGLMLTDLTNPHAGIWGGDAAGVHYFNIHPLSMTVAFAPSVAVGALAFRAAPLPQRSWRKALHGVAMTAAVVASTVGFSIVVHHKVAKGDAHMASAHAQMGVAVYCLFILNWILAVVSFVFKLPSAEWRARIVGFHRVCGAVLVIATSAALVSGFGIYAAHDGPSLPYTRAGGAAAVLTTFAAAASVVTLACTPPDPDGVVAPPAPDAL